MILIKIDGISGNSNLSGHKNWISCLEVILDVERQFIFDAGNTVNPTGGTLQFKEVIIKKQVDSTSSKLFQLMGSNEGKQIEIHFLSESGPEAKSMSEWTLENALISGYTVSVGANGQEEAVETLRLNFVTIEIKSFQQGDDGTTTPFPVKFNRDTGLFV